MFIISLCHLILAVSQTHWWWLMNIIQTAGEAFFWPAGCWSQNQWSAFRPLPLPSWQRFFLWNSASYSFCSNPPGAFANPAAMEIGCRWHFELTWVHLLLQHQLATSCAARQAATGGEAPGYVGRLPVYWLVFRPPAYVSPATLGTGVWPKHHLATPAGRYRLLRQPYLRQAGVRQVRNQTERQQLFPRDCVPVQRSNPLTTRTRCGGSWRLPLKLSGQTSVGEMFWFCTSMTLYIIICCHKGVPFCQVRWAQKIQIWQELVILDHGSITSQP